MALNQPNRPHLSYITGTAHGEEVLAPGNCDRSLRTLQEYSKDVGLLLCIATCKAKSWLKGFLVLMFSMGLIYESEPNSLLKGLWFSLNKLDTYMSTTSLPSLKFSVSEVHDIQPRLQPEMEGHLEISGSESFQPV